ncbi:MAG: hypothetical protein IT371_21895 [Deltaproteobacteria bacterium]|nr:hypothetical protein [Deltaproteobacteria bacterium]
MLEGAIIGAVVGVIVSVVMLLKRGSIRKKVLGTLQAQGPAAARSLLDRRIPPTRKIALRQILDQRERMAALTIFGDVAALEEEVAAHGGSLTAVVQVNGVALLGAALRSADARPAAERLVGLAEQIEREGGITMGLVKKKTRALATLAMGVTGVPIPTETRLTLDGLAGEGGMVQILIWQALARAVDAMGQREQAASLRRKVEELTSAFAQPPGHAAA